jgi:hypothetical protein
MQANEMHVCRGASPFITKVGTSPILSPIMKPHASPFITKVGASPIPYIEDKRYSGGSPFHFPLIKCVPG